MIRKHFTLTEESYNVLLQIMKSEKLSTESAAANFALQFYERQTMENAEQSKNVLTESQKTMKILKESFRETEKNVAMILDGINTILIERGYHECHPADMNPSRVLQESERLQKKKIIKMKQVKDYRLSRRK